MTELAAVRAGTQTLLTAVSTYENDVRHRGSAVIALSMTTVDRILAGASPVASAVTRATLPLLAWTTALRRRSAAGGRGR